ncbi:MAG: hypothetical protein C0506_03815 [Anaerolinea sp.]|nr:hypothetical protein [Anaerolinea sp.]
MRVRLARAARREARLARFAFAHRDPGSVETFERSMEDAVARLEAFPEAGAGYLQGTRRLRLETVPYYLVYRVTAREVRIIAVVHTSQRPGYWEGR